MDDLKLDNKESKQSEKEVKEPRFLNLSGTVVSMQRMENGGVNVNVIVLPRQYPPKGDGETDEQYRSRCKNIVEQINVYNALVYGGLRFDDVVIAQEVLE